MAGHRWYGLASLCTYEYIADWSENSEAARRPVCEPDRIASLVLVPQQKEGNHWRRRLAWLSSVAQVLWVIELVSIAERSDYLMTSLHRDMCQPDSGRVGAVNARSEQPVML